MQFKLTAFYALGFFEIFKVRSPLKVCCLTESNKLIVLSCKLRDTLRRQFMYFATCGTKSSALVNEISFLF